jgi:basic amino acid/polyamine antiporter, APA family
VLIYYAITNLAALRLPAARRLYPGWIAWAGLVGCLGLAWWVEPRAWLIGLGLLILGFIARALTRRLTS